MSKSRERVAESEQDSYMAVRIIRGIDELRSLVGQSMGASDWVAIDQQQIDMFAQCTGDTQWIHCDPERAAAESPYQATVAHGYLTLSLVSMLLGQTVRIEGVRMIINYGLNRVRFPGPVIAGSRVRMLTDLLELNESPAGMQMVCRHLIEVEGKPRPACVAETVFRLFV